MASMVRIGRLRRGVVALLAAVLVGGLLASPAAANGSSGSYTPIYEIQGAGHISPLLDETVTTRGIVTAVAFRGYYVQDAHGDGKDATADGMFISTSGSPAVQVGDEVELTGVVSEFRPGNRPTDLTTTQMRNPSLSVLSSGNPLPQAVTIGQGRNKRIPPARKAISANELPVDLSVDPGNFNPNRDGIDFYESLEGMRVVVDRPVAVSATRQFGNFSAEIFTLPSRGRFIEPEDARTQRGGINLVSGKNNTGDPNPERVQIQFDATLFGSQNFPAIPIGSKLDDVPGVVGYSFGNYEVNATSEFGWRTSNNRPDVTSLKGSRLHVTVASYNVLNLDPGPGDDAQRAKLAGHIVDNLRSPDVVALQEIQDNSGNTDDGTTDATQTLQALVDAIAAAGGPAYDFFDVAPADGSSGGIPGGNIRNAFLYNPARVDLVDFVSLTPSELAARGADPTAFDGTRDPLQATFRFNGNEFTVINNHMTSRFGSTPIFGSVHPFVQAGEAEREAQAGALNQVVDSMLAEDDEAKVMVVGDLNTFEFTNDIKDILRGRPRVLTNLIDDHLRGRDKDNRYTFVFEGNSQVLDHFLITDALVDPSKRFQIIHVNTDYPRTFNDVTASDHEPLVARFRMKPVDVPKEFTLQVLHASDLEGGVDALDRAANFAAIVDRLEDADGIDGTVRLSAGDNYIPGPFFSASGDRGVFRDGGVFNDIYNDLFGVSGYTSLREGGGRVDISIMNAIGFDASAVGNHEFDLGSDAFESIIEQEYRGAPGIGDDRWVGSQFPYLSANLDFSADPDLGNLFTNQVLQNTRFETGPAQSATSQARPKLAPATWIDVGGGQKVGVVGATTQVLETISSPGGTTVIGPSANDMPALAGIIQPQVDRLKALGINKIILVSHLQQIALETELAGLLDGVDIIIAGGSDTLLANPDDVLRTGDVADDSYPVLETDANGDPVAIVSTAGEYSYVGRLVVKFNRKGVLVHKGNRKLTDVSQLDAALNGPVRTTDDVVVDLWGSLGASTAPGTKANLVDRLVEAARGVVIAKDSNVVGETTVFLEGRRERVRTEETNLGNLGADANLWQAQQHDPTVEVSIKNGGGLRAEIGEIVNTGGTTSFLPPQANPLSGKLEGQISQLDIENSLRFNNGLTLLTLTPAQLLQTLEHAVSATAPGATPGQFAQVGGVRFSYDPALPAGSRIDEVVIIDLATGADVETIVSGGAVVAPATRTIRVVTLNFLVDFRGDNYPFADFIDADPVLADEVVLGDVLTDPGAFTWTAPGGEQDALAEYLDTFHGIGDGTPFGIAETPIDSDTRIVPIA